MSKKRRARHPTEKRTEGTGAQALRKFLAARLK